MVSIAILLAVVSFSYAYIKYDTEEKDINVIGTDCIKLEMEDISEGITLQKAYPMTDDNGEATNPYKFRLTNECSVGVNYQIELRVENSTDENAMPVENNIATKVDDKTKVVLSSTNKVPITETQTDEKYTIGNGTLEPYGEKTHEVRIWLDEGAGNETQNKIFKSKVVVEAIQNQIAENNYKEALLHGADPVLGNAQTNEIAEEPTTTDKLIPVIIKEKGETGTTVTVADLTEEWYSYEKHEWANAVILTDSSKNPEPGTELQEDEIESYFVWIPKYSYKLFDEKLGNYSELTTKKDKSNQAIEIQFGTENTTDIPGKECTTPEAATASGSNGNCDFGEYMTHPAFLAFGGNGLWVGKFETGHNGGALTEETKKVTYSESDLTEILIKPNEYAWTYTNVATTHQLSINYQESLNSHMMKNTEWGAVAYLTQSIYGRCSDSTHCGEVMINNNSNYVTGYAATSAPENGQDNSEAVAPKNDETNSVNYNNHISVKASTTGNYTGIYDMSGGVYEHVMGVMFDNNDKRSIDHSGFIEETFPNDYEYYDKYKHSNENTDYTRRILGDATGEIMPFENVNDSQDSKALYFVYTTNPWFYRGGSAKIGRSANLFVFAPGDGNAYKHCGFRIVLAPQQ